MSPSVIFFIFFIVFFIIVMWICYEEVRVRAEFMHETEKNLKSIANSLEKISEKE